MRSKVIGGILLVIIGTQTMVAGAAEVRFVPPNDPVGQVWSYHDNDTYSSGRGVVFTMTGNVPIDAVSIYHDLTNIDLYFEVAEIPVATGFVWEGRTTLRSGTHQVSTSGLEFIALPFEALTLENSKSYLIGFKFEGRANQNFFYNNQNVRFSVDHFTDIDGVDNKTANFVMPAVAVNVVPEPATLGLVAAGLGAVWMGKRRVTR